MVLFGKKKPEAESSIKVGYNNDEHVVILDFEQDVSWLSLDSADARALAQTIVEAADMADNVRTN